LISQSGLSPGLNGALPASHLLSDGEGLASYTFRLLVGCLVLFSAMLVSSGCSQRNAGHSGGLGAEIPASPSAGTLTAGSTGTTASSGSGLVTSVSERRALVKISSVLVAPLQYEAGARGVSGDASQLDSALFDALRQELDLQLTSWADLGNSGKQSRTLTDKIVAPEVSRGTALEAAKRRGANAVFLSTLHEYQDRKGSELGASQLARAYLTFSVVVPTAEPNGGKTIWEASYRFRDQPIAEDLLRLKDRLFKSDEGVPTGNRVGFRDGEELLFSGFRDAARELASARMRSFVTEQATSASVAREGAK